MPDGDFSYYTNAKHKFQSRWEDAITQDLTDDVEYRFPVLQGREHAGVAGISMGGYGAVKLALKHPDRYSFAGSISGALDITRRTGSLKRWGQTLRIWNIFGVSAAARRDEDVFNLLSSTKGAQSIVWFESCGKEDPLFSVNQWFARDLIANGANVRTVTTPGGHDWNSWNVALPKLFEMAEKTLH